MSVEDLSPGMQNYLKIIWGLQEWNSEPVSNSAIAESADVRLSTVSDALRKLSEQGLIEHVRYGRLTLTDEGRRYAVEMIRRHRLLETYLVQRLGYEWDEVHDEADRLEHAVSDQLINRMDSALNYPSRDPHGDPIPSRDGLVERLEAAMLWGVRDPCRVRVERISDFDNEMLQYFASCGIVVGAELEVLEREPFSETVLVRVLGETNPDATDSDSGDSSGGEEEGKPLNLGEAAASAIWVSVI